MKEDYIFTGKKIYENWNHFCSVSYYEYLFRYSSEVGALVFVCEKDLVNTSLNGRSKLDSIFCDYCLWAAFWNMHSNLGSACKLGLLWTVSYVNITNKWLAPGVMVYFAIFTFKDILELNKSYNFAPKERNSKLVTKWGLHFLLILWLLKIQFYLYGLKSGRVMFGTLSWLLPMWYWICNIFSL